MQRPEKSEYREYYGQYISLVGEGDVVEILRNQIRDTTGLLAKIPEERGTFRYAPGKWSIKEIVGHIADTERIMSYRALRFARNDKTPLPGFEQNDYVPAAHFDSIPLAELAAELETLRHATCAFLDHVDEKESLRSGSASGAEISVRAIAYIIAGHELHHRKVIEQRYLKAGTTT